MFFMMILNCFAQCFNNSKVFKIIFWCLSGITVLLLFIVYIIYMQASIDVVNTPSIVCPINDTQVTPTNINADDDETEKKSPISKMMLK